MRISTNNGTKLLLAIYDTAANKLGNQLYNQRQQLYDISV